MTGYVYFLSDGAAIKVGFSAQPTLRLRALTAASLKQITVLGKVPGTRSNERAIHFDLAEFCIKGEWFADNEKVRSYISNILAVGSFSKERPARSQNVELTDYMITAQKLASLIVRFHPVAPLAELEAAYGLPPRALWEVRYRPPQDITTGRYFALCRAAHKALLDAEQQLKSALEFVATLYRADHSTGVSIAVMEDQISKLKNELADLTCH
jgi:hypothetical protein